MGKKSLNPWVADCVWHELAAVTTWKQETITGIKPDPESRFEDDGSNFRSRVSGQEQCLVQLIEVLAAVEPVKVILSDGVTKIKAQLAKDVVTLLETETEETFSSEVTGDVFQLTNFTIISTIFGPADDFVQLSVEGAEYEHHLRKLQGEPKPIEQDEDVRLLLEDITKLRCPPIKEEQTTVDRSDGRISTLVPSTQSQYLPSGIQSQYPASRQRAVGPSLNTEGFQVAQGLNLHRPIQAASDSLASKATSALTNTNSVLMGLLAPQKAPEAVPPPSLQPIIGQKRAREASPPESRPRQSPMRQHKSSGVVAETPAKVSDRPIEVLSDSDPEPEERTRSQQAQAIVPAASNRSPPSAQPPPQVTSVKSSGSSGQSRIPYGRRKVPANQQKLLDDKSCWIPSQPGYRFPQPNVPIELLTKWNKTATPSPRKPGATQESDARNLQSPGLPTDVPMDDDDARSSVNTSDVSNDSDDGEFSSEDWPPSSPPRRPELPPDSSWENDNVIQGTQQDDLEVAVPRALPVRKSPSRPSGPSMQPPTRHALPPRPPVSVPSRAAMNDVVSPSASLGMASQRSLPPNSSIGASTRQGASQAALPQSQIPPQQVRMSPQASQGSVHSSPYPEVRRLSDVVAQEGFSVPQQPAVRPQRPRPSNSPISTMRTERSAGSQVSLKSDIDPYTLSEPQLRRLLIAHDIPYSSSAKRFELVELLEGRDARLQQELAQTRLRLADLQDKKRRKAESSAQSRVNGGDATGNETLDMTAAQQSPPRSSFRNPTMVGRKPPAVQASPLATPLRRQGSDDAAALPRHPQGSSPTVHTTGRSVTGPVTIAQSPSPALSDQGRTALSAETSRSRGAQQASPTPRGGTRLAMPSDPTASHAASQPPHPDELHCLARRDHFGRSGRRETWIEDNFERVNYGNKTVKSIFDLYKEQHPEDPATDLDKITRAAQIVFRSSREALATARFRRVNMLAVPAPAVTNKEQALPVESTRPAQPSSSAQRQGLQSGPSNATPTQLDGTSEHPASAPRSKAKRRGKARPITEIDGAQDEAHDVLQMQDLTAADTRSRSALDDRVEETVMSSTSSDALREFCQNWLNIRPGGAFAKPHAAPRRVRRKVDVLGWDI